MDNNQQKLLDELKYDQYTKKMNNNSSTIKVRPAPTPFGASSFFNLNNNKNSISSSNMFLKKRNSKISNSSFILNDNKKSLLNSAKKKIVNKRNREFSSSIRDNNNRSTSKNSNFNTLKDFNTITTSNFYKKNIGTSIGRNKFDDNKK